ncbi:MAG TPA: oxidoreductase [Alphaproteobacteria bacterium]|nr:oxidoreductase [Alphaproteobacteria bacterium]HAM47388.1 oxidoreductase [Alphaproteobacteria bacterium]HBC53007.1 oxidoreductase [Alphaproteobacteria bacterium]
MGYEDKELKWVGTRQIRPDGVDKVTGRANFGADLNLPGMLTGKILRSPHPHAKIVSINTDKAAALPGVKAIVTGADMPEMPSEMAQAGEGAVNFRYLSNNIMAHDKVLYDGHPVAAVAAISDAVANEALALIEVEYEVLPHVIDVEEAMKPDAPVLHDTIFTAGVEPKPEKPSNVVMRVQMGFGDPDAGYEKSDVVIERNYTTKPVHQGYIEPHAAVVEWTESDECRIWCSSQGQFMVRTFTAKLLDLELAQVRVTPAEIGGGFGGKTTIYLEPVAAILSRKSHRPVRMVMSRDEVFRATGPTSGTAMRVKIGATKDGKILGAEAELKYQAGAYPGSPVAPGCMTAFAPYALENVKTVGYDVVVNRPLSASYRAPGAPMASFAVESAIDELAQELGMDPIDLRLKNAAKEGTQAPYGPKFKSIGYIETLEAAKAHPNYNIPLGPNQGRGVASGFWFNIGMQSSATVNVAEDGTVCVISGNPDIGGSRASLAMMAAEVLGVDYNKVKIIVGDTASIGYNDVTGGSRVTFATGMAIIQAAEDVVQQLRERAAMTWDIGVDAVVWEDGFARPASANAGDFKPLSLADIAAKAGRTGGPINGKAAINARGAGAGFGTHICDVEVDPDTGHVTVLRYTAVQDAGKAIHPGYVEGQMQGGVAQGVGWALNEEYIYGEDGRLQNPGFLDYRMPVASDLPMIDTVIVEVPNPAHPFGVRGVGEVPIVPPLGATANAVSRAIGKRMTDLPLSPPAIVAALDS